MLIPVHACQPRDGVRRPKRSYRVVAFAIVDDDMAHLAKFYWTLSRHGYARAQIAGKCDEMHFSIVERKPGFDISHENANKLDNRLENLAFRTRSRNMANPLDGTSAKNKRSGIRGITMLRHKLSTTWRGQVTLNKKDYLTPHRRTLEEAVADLNELRLRLGVFEPDYRPRERMG